ncbi:hypothetical protein PF004_g15850 [Phytophthora fragariae]|uniref:Winged helix-turn helix domain-containing protein n=1 Tax=Phytophthora fragariae TaxID=53985 RepID=A0A6G0NK56_9STRA|nr:hypothetical protein PF004_g15850 [Phytophthora fragariae]
MARKRHEFSPAEKDQMVSSHAFFTLQKKRRLFPGKRANELVAESLGCSATTIKAVMKTYRADNNTKFEIAPTIEDYIDRKNRLGEPTTTAKICDEVFDLHEVSIGVDAMNRLLVELGYHYIKGEKRHIHADSEGNVAFRETYLAKKLANRVKVQGRYGVSWGVVRPEVFLDESYCNVNHVTGKIWLTSEKVRYGKTGKGPRACIIAAGVIKTRGAVTTGEFVEGSIKVWNSALKRKLWDEDDYHGNFDAEQFERWFQNLCSTLKKAKYGECTIHMDGASYHKRITNKTPTMSWLKAAIVAWIIDMIGHAFNP